MAIFGDIFKAFTKSADKTAVKATSKSAMKSGLESGAKKTESIVSASTKTKVFSQSPMRTAFKDQATKLVSSRATNIAAKTVVVGGATYGALSLAGNGLDKLGYGFRGLTNNYTSQDLAAQDIQNKRDNQALNDDLIAQQEKYIDWLKNNGYADSSNARQAYNDLIGNSAASKTDSEDSKNYTPWIYGGLAVAAAVGAAVLLSKKGKK